MVAECVNRHVTVINMSSPRRRNVTKILIGLLVVVIALVLVYFLQKPDEQKNSAAAETASAPSQKYKFELAADESSKRDELSAESVNLERLRQRFQKAQPVAVDTTQLDVEINAVMSQNSDIIFGISIKDLSTGTVYDYGNKEGMTAASVTKVLTATDYLKQVELGSRSLSTVMSNGQTAQQNIEQMIVVSDNDAWHILNENLTYTQMQSYAHSIGLTSYDYTDNTISASHTTLLLGDLYGRKLINESNTQLLLSYMERANYRDLIIPAVPPHDTVYHKAGEYLANLNDAAIITNATDTIVLSIFTKSTAGYSKSRVSGLMQKITTPTLTTFKLN